MLVEKEDFLNRWIEDIGELFHDVRGAFPIIPDTKTGPKILQAEVRAAIKKMRKTKQLDRMELS